jgi:hypothetical protein
MEKAEGKPPLFASTSVAPDKFCQCYVTPELYVVLESRALCSEATRNRIMGIKEEDISFGPVDISYDQARQLMREAGAENIVKIRIRTDPHQPNCTREVLIAVEVDDEAEIPGMDEAIPGFGAGCPTAVVAVVLVLGGFGYDTLWLGRTWGIIPF